MKSKECYISFSLLLFLALSCIPYKRVSAQDQFRVLDWKTQHTLRTYLLQEMHSQYDARRKALSLALSTPEAISEYSEECHQKYLQLLGDMPPVSPLNAMMTGRIDHNTYILEKIIFESRPGHHVTANIYLPKGEGPFPAVIIFCGHEMTSKATESYQETAKLFAENGFISLVVDPISQGERVQFTDADGNRILRGSTTEHTLLNAGALLTGSGVVAWELNDNIRSLDYLVSRPEVAPERIGCLGNSGGGAQTLWFIAYDRRVRAAAPCSFITSREREYELNGTGDGCQQIPYEGREKMELADYLIMFAPKPLLILASRYDFVDYRGTTDTFNELETVYQTMGYPDKVSMFTSEEGHGISLQKQVAAVKWFRKWLCNDNAELNLNDTRPEPESDTWSTSTGQVTSFFPNETTVQETNRKIVRELEETRNRFVKDTGDEGMMAKLRELTCVPFTGDPVTATITGEKEFSGFTLQKLIIRRKGEVPMPCLILNPDKGNSVDTLVIWLDNRGKSSVMKDSRFMKDLSFRNGVTVVADLRGMGETAEETGANDPKYYNSEYHNAVLSLHIGQPLPGQRARDIIMLLDYIGGNKNMKEMPVRIIANGPGALAALIAASLDRRISSLELSGTISSFREITDRPMEMDWFSYVVPGIMRYFDLPDLAAMRPDLKIIYISK